MKSFKEFLKENSDLLDESELNEKVKVTVSVSGAKKANELAQDMFRGEYKNSGSNVFVFDDEDIAASFEGELTNMGIK